MKKFPRQFYKDLKALRDVRGETEYDRDDIRPDVVLLIKNYGVEGGELLDAEADRILDNAERSDDKSAEGLFPHDAHVALGGKRRVKRGAMTMDQCMRRKRVIDHNKMGQDAAWAAETDWLHEQMDGLDGRPAKTKVRDLSKELEPAQ